MHAIIPFPLSKPTARSEATALISFLFTPAACASLELDEAIRDAIDAAEAVLRDGDGKNHDKAIEAAMTAYAAATARALAAIDAEFAATPPSHQRNPYERVYGDKYQKGKSTTEIAALYREDVKKAVKAGTLKKGIKVSVRTEYYSMGSSINVTVKACPGLVLMNPERLADDLERPNVYSGKLIHTEEAQALLTTLKDMLSSYNHDGSDLQTDYHDVRFHSDVRFDYDLERAEREAFKAAHAQVVA